MVRKTACQRGSAALQYVVVLLFFSILSLVSLRSLGDRVEFTFWRTGSELVAGGPLVPFGGGNSSGSNSRGDGGTQQGGTGVCYEKNPPQWCNVRAPSGNSSPGSPPGTVGGGGGL